MKRPSLPLIAPGTVIHRFTPEEASHLAADWLAVFGRDREGAKTEAYLWHVFGYERYPHVSGEEALGAYRKQVGAEFVVLSNNRDLAFLTEQLPESSSLADYLVFPRNFAWTMAFTHEDGWLGPYFARHPDFARLDAENRARLKKHHEIEAARRKGWM